MQDDAFISFRYARNLANGNGLVFNTGERIEGYTNFLWTLLMAIPHLLHIDAVFFAQATGLACFAGTLLMTHRLAGRVLGSESDSLLVVLLLASNYSFLCYATGGLETQLQTLLLVVVAYLGLADRPLSRARDVLCLSWACTLALMTRLDSLIALVPPMWLATVRSLRTRRKLGSGSMIRPLGWSLPALMSLLVWLGWKMSYYGEILPNTVHVKGAETAVMKMGLQYGYIFVRSYLMVPALLLSAVQARNALRSPGIRVLGASLAAWAAYVISVGGDFMEFRILVPVLPFFFIVLLAGLPRSMAVRSTVVASLVLGSLYHASTFRGAGAIEPMRNLQAHVLGEDDNWRQIGLDLQRLFATTHPAPLIATTAVGAIPYYSRLPTVDMLGLTDREVALHGLPADLKPGHRKLATTAYLLSRGVNFVLGHPEVRTDARSACDAYLANDLTMFRLKDSTRERLPADANVVDLPLDRHRVLRVLYLIRNPQLDELVARVALRVCPIGATPSLAGRNVPS
ncbi:MAG TPA: hypothetical protein VFW45_13510 [Candidatus Polarisedimenticolia bacterium]|nr:hypothetical protein [Candidatus Polarisedimenticolia bacterium]